MPRSESRFKVTIWSDRDFTALTIEDQRNYMMLVSQPTISLCGVVPITWGRWESSAPDCTSDALRASFDRLESSRFIIVDYGTDELFVRSFLRHDGVWRNVKTRAGARAQVKHIVSAMVKTAVLVEMDRAERDRKGREQLQQAKDGSWDGSSDRASHDEEWDGAFPDGFPSQESLRLLLLLRHRLLHHLP